METWFCSFFQGPGPAPSQRLCYWVPSSTLGEGNWAILGLAGRPQHKQEQEEPHRNQGVQETLGVCVQPAEQCLRT